VSLDPAKLILAPLAWDGNKSGLLAFRRSVFQTGLGHGFGHFLELLKNEAIAALVLDITLANGDEEKAPSPDATAKATAWYQHASPIVAA
jgi:hypothetical protein